LIVVAGMHRSGTSALAEFLLELGVDLGDPAGFYAADQWNERGYFEQRDVIDLNSRIISGLSRTGGSLERWLGQLVYLSMPPASRIRARAERLGGSLRVVARKYEGRAVKDPRFCLTLPSWKEIGAVQSLVVCVRHPADVADSLWRRQRIPVALGLRFWDYHARALLAASEGVPGVFAEYEKLLEGDLRTAERLSKFLSLGWSTPELEARRGRVLTETLRRSRVSRRKLPDSTSELYAELRGRCSG